MPTRLFTLALVLASCSTAPDDVCVAERKLSANRLSANRLSANRLSANALLTDAVPDVALTSASIADAIAPEALADEFVQSVLEYMVSCALAPGQSVEVAIGDDLVVYEGELGLAPGWGAEDGSCDAECRGWVSACLIARTNAAGESVQISLLGDRPGLEPSAEESILYDLEEATYFGDLFGATKSMYACLPTGATGPARTCGDDPAGCAIAVIGACDEVCDDAGCRDPNGLAHAETITVNLRDPAATCD